MEKCVYLDHAASSVPDAEAVRELARQSEKYYANAEAVHGMAYDSRRALASASERLGEAFFNDASYQVIWGSSATELFRVLASFRGFRSSLASVAEHPALLANLKKFTVSESLQVDKNGSAVTAGTPAVDLACIHHVQSETGVIQDVSSFACTCNAGCHAVDAVQAAGKMPLGKNVDIQIISGVKFGAPGGAAMLLDPAGKFTDKLLAHAESYRKEDYAVSRVSVPYALALAAAAEKAVENMAPAWEKVTHLNRMIREGCADMGIVPTMGEEAVLSPYILNLLLPFQESAVVVRALSQRGVYVSSGSACSAESGRPSAVLRALGITGKRAYRTLRISFGRTSREEDSEIFISELKNVLKNY